VFFAQLHQTESNNFNFFQRACFSSLHTHPSVIGSIFLANDAGNTEISEGMPSAVITSLPFYSKLSIYH
jgi:hypothetical protein